MTDQIDAAWIAAGLAPPAKPVDVGKALDGTGDASAEELYARLHPEQDDEAAAAEPEFDLQTARRAAGLPETPAPAPNSDPTQAALAKFRASVAADTETSDR
jgi:hypothetical protein